MRFVLDTHTLLWWLADDRRIRPAARKLIADPGNDVFVSVASLWEIAVKVRVGKLKADITRIEQAVVSEGFGRLTIKPAHLGALALLPIHHRDPFDHLLIAQAIVEDAIIVSDDGNMAGYPVRLQRCDAR